MSFVQKPSWKALRTRYEAGIEAVKAGADPHEMFWLVLHPPVDVEAASRGELPQGYRWRTDEEVRAIQNERMRRYAEPMTKRWQKEAA